MTLHTVLQTFSLGVSSRLFPPLFSIHLRIPLTLNSSPYYHFRSFSKHFSREIEPFRYPTEVTKHFSELKNSVNETEMTIIRNCSPSNDKECILQRPPHHLIWQNAMSSGCQRCLLSQRLRRNHREGIVFSIQHTCQVIISTGLQESGRFFK